MFSQASVIPSVHGGEGVVSQHATGKRDVFPGGVYPGESVCPGGDVCLPEIATEAGGTHPTGMHSCFTFCRFLVV